MFLGMLSLFIVIPYLSSNKELYGIYAICSSLTIFFSYADIGFVSSGQKFASEAFIKNENKSEMEILGFTNLILICFMGFVSLIIFYLSSNPGILIQGIDGLNSEVARKLMFILACSSPIYCFQRIVQIIYSVRMSDYYFQVLQIVGNLLKILSVFYFFRSSHYEVVEYYFCFQVISAIILIASIFFASSKFNIDFFQILKNIKFERVTYDKLKGLAFASLYGSICWILYYELDNMAISKMLGAKEVAIYSVAFSILSVFRNIFGTLYSPHITRFNYFVGLNDSRGLNKFVKMIIEFYLPFCLIPIIIMEIVSKPFIISWVGTNYMDSVAILSSLLCCNLLAFSSYPSSLYITATKKNKYLYINSSIIVLVFWIGVFLTYKHFGAISFATMKATGMIMSAIYSFTILFYIMKESKYKFIMRLCRIYALPILMTIGLAYLVRPLMFYTYGKLPLMLNIVYIIGMGIVSYLFFYLFSSVQRQNISQVFRILHKNSKTNIL